MKTIAIVIAATLTLAACSTPTRFSWPWSSTERIDCGTTPAHELCRDLPRGGASDDD